MDGRLTKAGTTDHGRQQEDSVGRHRVGDERECRLPFRRPYCSQLAASDRAAAALNG